MKAAALIFCTLAHPCNIDMYIKELCGLVVPFVVLLD